MIRWESEAFTTVGYPPQKRCEIVSQKFQAYLEQGILNYITTGRENHERVICVSKEEGGPCGAHPTFAIEYKFSRSEFGVRSSEFGVILKLQVYYIREKYNT